MPTSAHIASLLLKALSGSLTGSEHSELEHWRQASENNRQLYAELTDEASITEWLQSYHPDNDQAREARVLATIHERIAQEQKYDPDFWVVSLEMRNGDIGIEEVPAAKG